MAQQDGAKEGYKGTAGTKTQQGNRYNQVGKMMPLHKGQELHLLKLKSDQGGGEQDKGQMKSQGWGGHPIHCDLRKGTKRTGIRLRVVILPCFFSTSIRYCT